MTRLLAVLGGVVLAWQASNAVAQVGAGGSIYSTRQATLQSFLRFTNTGNTAGSIGVNVRNAATGATLGQWLTAPIPVDGEFQFSITALEASLGIGDRPDFYSISLEPSIPGFFQHVLFRPADGTLTNVTTCQSGVIADPNRLSGVHTSLLQAGYPSTVVVNNTGTRATTVVLGVYDARNGSRRGTYTTPSIPAGGQLLLSIPTIEAVVGAPLANMLHYVIKTEEPFSGYLQHLVNNVQVGVTTDMTVACNLSGYSAPAVESPNRISTVLSTASSTSQSFLRLHNTGAAAGTVALTLRNAATGALVGQWTSPSIPVNAELQFGMGTIEAAAGVTPANRPEYYAISAQSGIVGYLQHVLFRPSDGTLTNLSTCASGVTADPVKLSGVHSSLLQNGFPSTVVVSNSGNAATTVTLGVYDARNGAKRGTYTTPSIPPGGSLQVSIPTLESAVGVATAGMLHYVVKTESAFTGYLQNLVNNVQAGVTTDMTAACALGVPPVTTTATYYVSTTGSDSWTGTMADPNPAGTDGPFLTLSRARTVVRALDKTALNQVSVMLRGGTYRLESTFQFTSLDSGTSATKIVYQAYPGETAILSGGLRVQSWENAGGNLWRASLATSVVNFESLFYNGARRLRARVGGALGTYYRVAEPVYLAGAAPPAAAPSPNCTTFVQGSGWLCYDRFKYKAADPIVSTWRNLVAAQGNQCNLSPGNSAQAGDVSVLVFEQANTSTLRVSCIDAANRIVYLTGPTALDPTAGGFVAERRYLVDNVQDALTQPGQWFLDRSATPWTLNYLANTNEDPNVDTVIIPQLSQLVAINGVENFTLQGLSFQYDNYAVPAAGLRSGDLYRVVPPAVSIQNSRNVTIDSVTISRTSGQGLDIISCPSNTTGNASWCVATAEKPAVGDIVVQNSAFFDLAASGMVVGRTQRATDTNQNVPQHVTVRNNVVAGFGRVFPGAHGFSQGAAHDVHYNRNDISNGFKAGISIAPGGERGADSSGAFNNVVSFNRIYNLLQGVMNDGSGVRIAAGDSTLTSFGNKIYHNRIYDISDASALDADGFGGDGIAVDDRTGLVDIQNNLIYRVSRSGVSFGSAPPAPSLANIVKNNIVAFTRRSAINNSLPYPTGAAPAQPIQVFSASNNIFLFSRTDASTPAFYVQGGCTFAGGASFGQFQDRRSNVYWRTDGGFASYAKAFHVQTAAGPSGVNTICQNVESAWTFYTFSGWQALGQDSGSVVANPGFASIAASNEDYALSASPGAGFKVFDTTAPGRVGATLTPPILGAVLPTQPFSAATDF